MPNIMPSPVFRWFVPSDTGDGLVPAAGYKAKFYSAGTTTAKAIYDADGVVYPSPSNTAILNSEGYAEIRLGSGNYKLVVTDPSDTPIYTQDDISGGSAFSTGFVNTVIDSGSAGLKDVDTGANSFVFCAGYYAKGDGGHGMFRCETSSTADDGGYTIASTFDPTKRWFRIPDEDDAVRAASYGYIGTTAANYVNNLLAACSYCQSNNKTLKIGPGSSATLNYGLADLYLYAPEFILEAGSMLTAAGSLTTVHFYGRVRGTREQHFTGLNVRFETIQINDCPEWFGGAIGVDNTTAFTKWFASLPNGGTFILPPGVWPYANTTAFPYPSVPFIMYGTIDATVGSDIPPGEYWPNASRVRVNQVLLSGGATLTASGTGIAIVGDSTQTGNTQVNGQIVTVGGSITSGTSISAVTDVAAGGISGTPGYLTGQAGSSGQRFKAGGCLFHWYDPTGLSTSGTGETDLKSYTLPANALASAGDRIVVRGHGVISVMNQNRRFRLLVGSSVFFDQTMSASELGYWDMEAIFYYIDSSTMGGSVRFFSDMQGLAFGSQGPQTLRVGAHPVTFTTTNVIQFKATASSSGTVTQYAMMVDYQPAP